MPLPDRGGSFKGVVVYAALTKTAKQGLPQLEFNVECRQWREPGGKWHDVGYYNWSIRGKLVLVSSRGEPNIISIEQAMEVFGWDGQSFSSLDAICQRASQIPCLIYVEPHQYEGKEYMEIRSIHNPDWEPPRKTAAPKEVRDWDAAYGSALRALPKKAVPQPAPPPPPPPPKPAKQPDPRSPEQMAEDVKKAQPTIDAAVEFVRRHIESTRQKGDHDAQAYWEAVKTHIDELPF